MIDEREIRSIMQVIAEATADGTRANCSCGQMLEGYMQFCAACGARNQQARAEDLALVNQALSEHLNFPLTLFDYCRAGHPERDAALPFIGDLMTNRFCSMCGLPLFGDVQ